MRLLAVGGSGFLGGYVLREAVRQGHEVLALARNSTAARSVEGNGAHPLACDLDDTRRLDEAFSAARCQALVCLASLGHGHGPGIVAAAEEAGIPRAVFVSTTAVTTTLHPPTKHVRLTAEQQIRGSGLDWTILRPTMIYGDAGDRNLSRLLRLLSRAVVLPVPRTGEMPAPAGSRGRCRHGRAGRTAATRGERLLCMTWPGPSPLPFAELLHTCASVVGSRTRLVPVPLAPLVALARGYERLSRHPRIRTEQLLRLAEDKAFPIDDAIRDLGYAPRAFASGIADEARMLGLAA